MPTAPQFNILYFAVLPMIHLTHNVGLTEQVLTLVPDRNFATNFLPEEVDGYVAMFNNRAQYITGGTVSGYEVKQLSSGGGRVVIQVVQRVG